MQSRKEWQNLYKTKAWQHLRQSVLLEALYQCQIDGCNNVATVADHIKAHKGDHNLFHDKANIQAVCKPCHDSHCQRRDRGGDVRMTRIDGWRI